jgi:thymidylate kinase
LAYYNISYLTLRPALARSTLVLNDRHFLDIFVDRKRYRYGGPLWLLKLIWRAIPKPDIVVILDAAPEVLQARKQEVSFEETARQCQAYRLLAPTLNNCHLVDATQSLERVVDEVGDVILQHLAMRVARRFGIEQCSAGLGPDRWKN